MVVLNKIYTRTGDGGETALSDGTRVAKHSLRVAAYGTVDETNATVGLARLHADGETDARLAMIQNDLFDLGADLSNPRTDDAAAEGTESPSSAAGSSEPQAPSTSTPASATGTT